MDEFGVLTERFGIKPQGKGAPMSAARQPPAPAPSPAGAYDFNAFGGSGSRSPPSSSFDYFDSVFSAAKPSPSPFSSGDDIFGGGSSSALDDVFGSFVSKPAPVVDDLLGGFRAPSKLKPPPTGRVGSDDLMPGFGSSRNGSHSATGKSSSVSSDDPFGILESTSTTTSQKTAGDPLDAFDIFNQSGSHKPSKTSNATPSLKPPPKPGQVLKADKVKTSGVTLIDELETFSMGGARNNSGKEPKERQNGKTSKYREAEDAARKAQQKSADDLLSSSVGFRSNSVPKSRAPTMDTLFDFDFDFDLDSSGRAETVQKKPSGISSGINSVSSAGNVADDLYSMLGDATFFGNFEEVQGESEERRNARLERQQRTQDRMAKAVADMNQRDRQTQHEQEEKRIIAEQMDVVIKRWATGKQGNLRALLSSLQQVLWPECGWETLSLTDLVTSASVKKAYRKATLCVHPDKVQQKGSTLHEKYIAEKVFDILKEAWNKFNRDER